MVMPRQVDPGSVGAVVGTPVGIGVEVAAGSSLGVGEDPAATVGSGAVAGVSVDRGVVATSGWRVVSWYCIRSDRSACEVAVGTATVDGSCPAVHAAKIN